MARRPRASSLPRQATELALAVPQVVGHRVGRMLTAGPLPSARDQKEFHRMGAEKVQAFSQAWLAMATSGWQLQQRWWQQVWALALRPQAANPWALWAQWPGQAMQMADVAARGLSPIHRKAVANARRLGGAPRGRR